MRFARYFGQFSLFKEGNPFFRALSLYFESGNTPWRGGHILSPLRGCIRMRFARYLGHLWS